MNPCFSILIFILMAALNGCSPLHHQSWDSNEKALNDGQKQVENIVSSISTDLIEVQDKNGLYINYPYHETIFPLEIAAPTFKWTDENSKSKLWLVTIRFKNGRKPIYTLVQHQAWTPDRVTWEEMKRHSIQKPLEFIVMGIDKNTGKKVTGQDCVLISVSPDRVDAPIFYRQIPLPFSTKNFREIKWRLGDISSYDEPKLIMDNIPVCGSCHMFSKDGKYLSMELNYKNDGGAQFITPVQKNIVLTKKNFMSWSDYPRPRFLPETRGLFGKLSPTARFIAASVNEISLALVTNEDQFSQVFFPTYGILGIHSVETGTIKALPGADNYEFVHANPNWSPDEKHIIFCRAKTKNEVHDDITHVVSIEKNEGIVALNKKYNIQFDLYRIPFNNGKGGIAEPVSGAGGNGMSNYFPRYSPDGRWIVFTQSKTGIMLQPDSRLFIIPSSGGTPREMTCNRVLFNSWHSWSPNGKWLLFVSKVNTPFSEIFLTHIDEDGNDSPPVLLSRFSNGKYAANVPEFANIAYDAMHKISVEGY